MALQQECIRWSSLRRFHRNLGTRLADSPQTEDVSCTSAILARRCRNQNIGTPLKTINSPGHVVAVRNTKRILSIVTPPTI